MLSVCERRKQFFFYFEKNLYKIYKEKQDMLSLCTKAEIFSSNGQDIWYMLSISNLIPRVFFKRNEEKRKGFLISPFPLKKPLGRSFSVKSSLNISNYYTKITYCYYRGGMRGGGSTWYPGHIVSLQKILQIFDLAKVFLVKFSPVEVAFLQEA